MVFLDEPTASLDPQARRNLWDLLSGLNDSGRTVVLTTHYLDEAEALCDRVAIMDHGRILQLDTPAALIAGLAAPDPDHHRRRRDRSRPPTRPRCSPGWPRSGGSTASRCGPATLEDVFLDLTGREYRA